MKIPDLLDGRLKVRHLRLLVAIDEHGGVVRAAEHLHLTQPAVSRGLRELEAVVGVELFDRTPTGVVLNVYGSALVAHAHAILGELTGAARFLAELADAKVGELRLGLVLAGAGMLLPQAISKFKAQRPEVSVIVDELSEEGLRAGLLAGELDLGIDRIHDDADDAPLHRQTLYVEPLRVICSAEHPARRLREPTLADVLHYPWSLPVAQTGLRAGAEREFRAAGLPLPVNRVETTSSLTLRNLLLADEFLAAAPALIAHADPMLAELPIQLSTRRTVGVLMPARHRRSPAAELFLRHLNAATLSITGEVAVTDT